MERDQGRDKGLAMTVCGKIFDQLLVLEVPGFCFFLGEIYV